MWLANEPVGWWPLVFPSLGTLWILMRGRTWNAAFGWAFLWAFCFFSFLFDWATSASGTVLAQLALSAVEALYIGVLGIVWAGLRRWPSSWRFTGWQVVVTSLAVVAWIAMEQLRGAWPLGGMPWGTLAFALVDSPLVGLAPVGSTQLVGAVAVLISILLAMAVEWLAQRRVVAPLMALVSAVILVAAPGFLPVGERPQDRVSVGIVQGNVPDVDTLGPDESRALIVTENHVEAARGLLGEPLDFILLPESTSDRDIRTDAEAGSRIESLSNDAGVPLVLGTQEYRGSVRENHYVTYYPGSGIGQVYSKQHPVPFGEYIPARDVIRKVTTAVDQVSIDMVAGSEPAILDVNLADETIRLATPICFEVAYTEIIAEAVRGGAQLLVVPTNNETFKGSGEPDQQFAMSRFRAIEFAKTTVQVATSGITGVIDSNGVVVYQSEFGTADARVVDLALNDRVTFAAETEVPRRVIGYILGIVAGIVGVGALGVSRREQRTVKTRHPRKSAT